MRTVKINLTNGGCLYDEVDNIENIDISDLNCSPEQITDVEILEDISREDQNKIFSEHGLEWIHTSRDEMMIPGEYRSYNSIPAPWWLVGYDNEDGEMRPVIAWSVPKEVRDKKKAIANIMKTTRIDALKLAIKLKNSPGGRFVSGEAIVPL